MTPKQQLLAVLLGGNLCDWVLAKRPMPWADIAIALHHATGVAITGESLRTWYAADEPVYAQKPGDC